MSMPLLSEFNARGEERGVEKGDGTGDERGVENGVGVKKKWPKRRRGQEVDMMEEGRETEDKGRRREKLEPTLRRNRYNFNTRSVFGKYTKRKKKQTRLKMSCRPLTRLKESRLQATRLKRSSSAAD